MKMPRGRFGSMKMEIMPTCDPQGDDVLVWRLPMEGQLPERYMGTAAPEAWVRALGAVGRDLNCLRCGREIAVDNLRWVLEVNPTYAVSVGWDACDGLGGWRIGRGLTMDTNYMDTTYEEAAVWAADTTQAQLAGYEFVQWPSRGEQLLAPVLRDAAPVWVEPHTGAVVAPLGQLCERAVPEW